MGRATVNLIEPHMYVAYMLNFKDNISIDRAINMWDDGETTVRWKGRGDYYNSIKLHEAIESRIKGHLQDFWDAQGLKQMSQVEEVIEFFKKYSRNYGWWRSFKHSIRMFVNSGRY